MTDFEAWQANGAAYGWIMPRSNRLKQSPIIRHFRAFCLAVKVRKHEEFYRALGTIPTGYDKWVIWGIAHGKERRYD